jgi:uncharacterized DUF497 family protein
VGDSFPFDVVLSFEWDSGNRGKNWKRHAVGDIECEEVFSHRPLLVADDPRHSELEARYFALGSTRTGRRLFVAFTVRQGRIRIISARDMSRRERQSYEEANAGAQVEDGSKVP